MPRKNICLSCEQFAETLCETLNELREVEEVHLFCLLELHSIKSKVASLRECNLLILIPG